MPRSPRVRSRKPPRGARSRNAGSDALATATIDAAIVYWRWLGEEFPRYAKAVSSELSILRGRRVGAREAALRIARLTQEYSDVFTDLPRRIFDQVDGALRDRDVPGRRRRQGRVID